MVASALTPPASTPVSPRLSNAKRAPRQGEKLDDATLVAIADAVGKTPAQVMIRWSLQHGYVCIPKSTNKKRIKVLSVESGAGVGGVDLVSPLGPLVLRVKKGDAYFYFVSR